MTHTERSAPGTHSSGVGLQWNAGQESQTSLAGRGKISTGLRKQW